MAMSQVIPKWDDDYNGPILSDEVDEQLWLVNILSSNASKLGEFNDAPVLSCTATHGGRLHLSTKWGEEELKEMSCSSPSTIMLSRSLIPFPDVPYDSVRDMLPSPPDPAPARMINPWAIHGHRQSLPASISVCDDSQPQAANGCHCGSACHCLDSHSSGGEEEQSDDLAYENALKATPEYWSWLTNENTATVKDSSQANKASGEIGEEMPSRDEIVRLKGVKTRIQLTFREDGQYVSKIALGLDNSCPTNWVLKGIPGDAVKELVSPIAQELRARHTLAVLTKRAAKRGGPSVRIQITEYTEEGGEYVKQQPGAERRRTLNETCHGATLVLVSTLLDYLFAANFGERTRNVSELVDFYRRWTEEGAQEPGTEGAGETPGRGSDTKSKNQPNTVQPTPETMRAEIVKFLKPSNIAMLEERIGSAKLDRVWELGDGYGRSCIDDLRSAGADRDPEHLLASTDGALESVFHRLSVLVDLAANRPPRKRVPTVELVRPDLVSTQWSRERHLGYWCLVHGSLCIVRSVHHTEQAAIAATPVLKGSDWQVVNPEGVIVASEEEEAEL